MASDPDQPDLFAELARLSRGAYARRSDPETSHEAAQEVEKSVTALEAIVLEALRNHPLGLTNHEIVEFTGLTWNTASPRLHPLVKKGWVIDSGERRPGPSGRNCIVWRLK
jgi:DNA-binding MarR family transcriptional regulator